MWDESDINNELFKELCLEADNSYSWQSKPMHKWSPSEVLEFINFATAFRFTLGCANLEKFNSISGYIFQTLTKDYCEALTGSNKFGEFIYTAKENYLLKENLNIENCNPKTNLQTKSKRKDNNNLSNIAKKRKDKGRSKKVWEFLLHLLSDEKTCPQIIRWENIDEGTFKFVKSREVARLWGSRKQNQNMNYEKLTRAMRYYYKSEVLLPVPKQRLVYKFGPRANYDGKLETLSISEV